DGGDQLVALAVDAGVADRAARVVPDGEARRRHRGDSPKASELAWLGRRAFGCSTPILHPGFDLIPRDAQAHALELCKQTGVLVKGRRRARIIHAWHPIDRAMAETQACPRFRANARLRGAVSSLPLPRSLSIADPARQSARPRSRSGGLQGSCADFRGRAVPSREPQVRLSSGSTFDTVAALANSGD